ncbi:MAG: hypothetical protein DWH91_00350 [Planctomycetota bacterium]|nr:MAG: hypothetical protein DWH91_00350 [Planctomycetota bacterium]
MSSRPASGIHAAWSWLLQPQSTGLAVSLVVHLLALVACGLYVLTQPDHESDRVTTIIENDETADALGAFLEEPLLASKAFTTDLFATPMPTPDAALMPVPLAAEMANLPSHPSDSEGESSSDLAGAIGGFLFQEPENTVKAGRFAAFSRPILRDVVGNLPAQYGEPGEAPRPGLDYFIVLQIRVDPKRKTYPIRDLIGSVVGTDGYSQQLPEGLYIATESGIPVEINLRRQPTVKVTDGTVQLMLRVPGAADQVRDHIYLKSKMLREEQTLQLVFGGSDD